MKVSLWDLQESLKKGHIHFRHDSLALARDLRSRTSGKNRT
jgi:hypothetical protein